MQLAFIDTFLKLKINLKIKVSLFVYLIFFKSFETKINASN